MPDDSDALLSWARDAAQEHRPRWIAVVDLSQLPHAGEPGFQRGLVDILREHITGKLETFFRLPRQRLVLVTEPGEGSRLEEAVSNLGNHLAQVHLGGLAVDHYTLPEHSRAFLTFCRDTAQTSTPHPDAETQTAQRRLANLAQATRMLATADIAPFVHEKPIAALTAGRADHWATELVIDLAEVERAIDVPIRDDLWVVHHIEPVLDARLLAHAQTERPQGENKRTLDLTPETVDSTAFARFRADSSPRAAGETIFELPHHAVVDRPAAARRAAEALHRDRFGVALDGVPPHAAEHALSLCPEATAIKLDVRGGFLLNDGAGDRIAAALRAAGERTVIADGVSLAGEVDAARALGLGYVQGAGAQAALEA